MNHILLGSDRSTSTGHLPSWTAQAQAQQAQIFTSMNYPCGQSIRWCRPWKTHAHTKGPERRLFPLALATNDFLHQKCDVSWILIYDTIYYVH